MEAGMGMLGFEYLNACFHAFPRSAGISRSNELYRKSQSSILRSLRSRALEPAILARLYYIPTSLKDLKGFLKLCLKLDKKEKKRKRKKPIVFSSVDIPSPIDTLAKRLS